jgi:ABC-type lipoprotein export system ATPase subunit
MSKEELVVFMGPTGSGKSTIICNLIGIKLVSEKKNTSRIVKESPSTNEPIKRPKIGHQKQIACTVLP